ncbi:MAG: MraY family glycosyltransferase [bacterium]|nr:MraY family glycosyltransferase [bacterium]
MTQLVRFLSFRVGAVDNPNARIMNKVPMPSAGGLAIVISFLMATLIFMPIVTRNWNSPVSYFDYILPVIVGGVIVAATGFIDDIYELSPKWKMFGIVIAAVIVYRFTNFQFESFKIPFGGPMIYFNEWLTFFLTILWIVSITNAINLIDGLDGLVGGVSVISLTTMGLISYFFLYDRDLFLSLTIFVLVAAIAGFFPYNYNPAIIYLGDTGALFIGFMIAVLSLQGLKNATAVAVISPVMVLGVPIIDTSFAVLRRKLSGRKISEADQMHLHHRLLAMGFTHRGAVLVVYGSAMLFSLSALLLNVSSRLGGILLVIGLLFLVEVFIENLEIMGEDRKPLMKTLKFIGNSSYRQEQIVIMQHRRKMRKKRRLERKNNRKK